MKMNTIIRTLTLALAALALPAASEAAKYSDGSIVDIRAVDSSGVCYGLRNAVSGTLCSESNPLVAGETLCIRVRMQVTNSAEVAASSGALAPQTWRFWSVAKGAFVENSEVAANKGIKLGLMIGNRIAYADYSATGINYWEFSGELESNDFGETTPMYRYYTDFYFKYTIQSGDIGMPIRLVSSNLEVPSPTAAPAYEYAFLGLNVGSTAYQIKNETGVEAKLNFAAGGLMAAWPTGPWTGSSFDGPIVSYDLSEEGIYAKTVDFDGLDFEGGDWSTGEIWRRVTPGGYDKSCPEAKIEIVGGAVAAEDTTVYIWSSDEDVFVPDGPNMQLLNVSTAADPSADPTNRNVLTVTIYKGQSSASFALKGAPGAALTDKATIYMTSTKGVVAKDAAGTYSIVAMSRPIAVTEAQATSVKIRINNLKDTTATVIADKAYETAKAQLWVIVEGETVQKTVVDLKATISGGDSLSNIYANNLIRLTESEGLDMESALSQVVIPAGTGTRHATCYIYALGATEQTKNPGIRFEPVIASGDAELELDRSPAATLKIAPQGAEAIKFDAVNPADGATFSITKTDPKTIRVKFADSYRNYFKPDPGAPYVYKGYTFKFEDEDTGDEYVFAEGVTPTSEGSWISVTGTFANFDAGKRYNLNFYGEAPDGSTTEKVRYTVDVTTSIKVVEVSQFDPAAYPTVCEGDTVNVRLHLKSPYANGCIFLRGASATDDALVSTTLISTGAPVDPSDNQSVINPQPVRYLDGGAMPGTPVTLKGFLGSNYMDPTATVAGWEEGNFLIWVTNKPPVVKSLVVAGQNCKASDSGRQLTPVSAGIAKTFRLTSVSDVAADWDTMDIKWIIDNEEIVRSGDPTSAVNTVTHTFSTVRAGNVATVEVFVKDKDMTTYPDEPNFSCTIPINKKPNVSLSTLGTTANIFNESSSGGAQKVVVKLSDPATSNLEVQVRVGNPASGNGFIRFQHVEGIVETNAADANVYTVKFPATVQTREMTPCELDGTVATAAVVIEAEVTTSDVTEEGGIKWSEYFSKADPMQITVGNDSPRFIRPSDLEVATTNMNASINTPYPVKIQAVDVDADLTSEWAGKPGATGVWYEVSVDSSTITNGYLTSSDLKEVNVEFESAGVHYVTVRIEDKDGGKDEREVIYDVQPSKVLKLYPVGPGPAVSTLGGSYASYPGIGAGRVFAGAAAIGPQKVENFVQTYSFLGTQADVDIWAFGYRADGAPDDGALSPKPDRGIDKSGNWNKTMTIAADGYYNYTDQHGCGMAGYDSFMYGWVGSTASEEGEAEPTFFPYIRSAGYRSIGLPDGSSEGSGNGKDKNKVTSYPLQKWEAVFSREYLKSDNCGDINLDGIPDIVLFSFGLGVVDTATQTISGEGGDRVDVSDYNHDENKSPRGYVGESSDGDFLPTDDIAEYGELIPSLIGAWDKPFTAIMEIRGAGQCLNDAFAPNFPDGAANRLAFPEIVSDRVYADPNTCPTSTLSYVEWLAWEDYAAANLPDGAVSNAAYFTTWSPERPTSPILVDTDGDGLPDGYEYYYWYRAHVGYMEGGVHKYMTGRRYSERNPGDGILITSAEIERAMDPITASGSVEQDSDNDGLPDVIEMLIGTNPFDFDTDGDGLPDGWELMIAGLNPLLPSSCLDAISDTLRNYDGDAMAISSYEIEKQQNPVAFDIERARRFTFAVLDRDGDTDGVQWYAMTKMPEFACTTQETATAWSFTAFGTNFVSYVEPKVTAEGLLGNTIEKGFDDTGAYLAGEMSSVTNISEDESVTNVLNLAVRGFPIRVPAGTPVSNVKDGANPVVMAISAGVKEKEANACWIYGKGTVTNAFGQVAKTANDYGCLALGRYQGVPEGAVLCALPEDTRDVAFLHYLCYQEFGFDPRTAWKAKDPLATRWSKAIDGDSVEGIIQMRRGGYTGKPTRTRDYTAYDEFLVYSFFVNNGCDMGGVTYVTGKAPVLAKIWGAFTTNPQGPNEAEFVSLGIDGLDYYFGRDSIEGADTDGDGVPDGWELYTMAGPKTSKGEYVFANPYTGFFTGLNDQNKMPKSFFSPFVASADTTDTSNQIYLGGQANDDLMNQYEEFEGTDTMAYYADYSSTVVHKGEWKWFNKFFPTDPWNRDTDGDGISDKDEGATEFSNPNGLKCCFIYGTPADDGKLWSIPGGGLNPCSVDTDGDGLPDPWERQFAGSLTSIFTEEKAPVGPDGKAFIDFAKDADGNPIGNALQGLTDGMDGTVKDATSYPFTNKDNSDGTSWVRIWNIDGFHQVVNRDYDHDGLENWQEYLTGMMRCWRYDDPFSPWESVPEEWYGMRDPTTGLFSWAPKYEKFGIAEGDDDAFWYMTLVDRSSPYYNPHLIVGQNQGAQYFTRVTNVWDTAYCDTTLNGSCSYYWFFDRVGGEKIADVWTGNMMNPGPLFNLVGAFGGRAAPTKYACCSPINADSDGDGMDDYYELFHGLNPLLGQSGQPLSAQGPADLVYDAWYLEGAGALEAWGAPDSPTQNYWQANPRRVARGSGFDFEVFPWLNGLQEADPDGDDIRNGEEAIMARLATKAWHHTDPTPLWMTDTTFSNSLVRQYFRLPAGPDNPDVGGAVVLPESGTFKHGEDVYHFRDFDGFFDNSRSGTVDTKGMPPYWFERFKPDFWSVYAMGEPNWLFSFEENEGYDTDHDGLSDNDELAGKLRRGGTDPLDVDSPRRRQAMYFQGKERPSALQSMPFVLEKHPYGSTIYPTDLAFLQYTVECWVMPESLDDSTVIERAVYVGESNPGDMEFMRCNFQLGIHGGKWYTKFDPNGTLAGNQVEIHGSDAELGKWTHLAATYDGATLRLYVDNTETSLPSGLQPSYGTSVIATQKDQTYWLDREYPLCAILVGASFRTVGDGITDGNALDVTQGLGWDRYKGFFKGYVDEIRVWDGARKAVDIEKDLNVRYDAARAAANRQAFYDQWLKGEYRYAVDGKGSDYDVVPELRFHWAFDSVFGAQNEAAVVKCPNGFGLGGFKAPLSRPEGYAIPWFETILAGYAGTVYDYPAWVTWIPNTVAHLPRFDGSTLDSIFWSADFAGDESGTFAFANSAEPYSRWTQYLRNGITVDSQFWTTGSRHNLVNQQSYTENDLDKAFDFAGRNRNLTGDDLIPLGGAFVKYVPNDPGLWDGQGASSTWELTGDDANGNGLPDWWELYADQNYREGVDPSVEMTWSEPMLKYGDIWVTPGEAYLRDIAKGGYLGEDGKAHMNSGEYDQNADADRNGLPDWWAELYGLGGESGLDDHDNDGLPNYVEYLLSEVFAFKGIVFDPTEPCSVDPYTPDYFFRVGELYVGEIFTDHDRMYDAWEDLYPVTYLTRLVYDAWGDEDSDGWSNVSEMHAGSDPTRTRSTGLEDQVLSDYPVPMIHARVKIPDNLPGSTPIVVQAFSGTTVGKPDATWSTSASGDAFAKEKFVGTNPGGVKRYYLSPGSISQGKVEVFFNDTSALTEYYTVIDGAMTLTKSVYTGSGWYPVLNDRPRSTGSVGDLVKYTGEVVGWINYTTGELELDFTSDALQSAAYVGDTGTAGSGENAQATETRTVMDLTKAYVRLAWSAKLVKQGALSDLYLTDADDGYVREGVNAFVAWADKNGNGAWDVGEPYGVSRGVDVSWSSTSTEIELTEVSPIMPRIRLSSGEKDDDKGGSSGKSAGESAEGGDSSDRGQTVTEVLQGVRDYIDVTYGNQNPQVYSNMLREVAWIEGNLIEPASLAAGSVKEQRVRIVRWLVNGKPTYKGRFGSEVVLDKTIQTSVKGNLTEADILLADAKAFDLDWANLRTDVVSDRTVIAACGEVTNVSYLVVVGDGQIGWTTSPQTNYSVKALNTVVTRRYGSKHVVPKLVSPGAGGTDIVLTASPTFKWTMNCPEEEGYTAFRIQVSGADGLVYDSGIQDAPPRVNGAYTWAAPLYVGDKTASGKVFANKTNYTWKATMYNAKFTEDAYSKTGTFRMDMREDGYSFGRANVAVKYFGPKSSYKGGKTVKKADIRVRAYTSPDFSGRPVAAGYVAKPDAADNGVSVTGRLVTANCQVLGLPKGSYYLQAFIDSNGNGVCDRWETSGYLCKRDGKVANYLDPVSIVFDEMLGEGDTAVIYLEDADTDADGLPDSWEYAEFGSLTAKGIELVSETAAGGFLVNTDLSGALELQADAKTASSGIAGRIGGMLNNAGVLALAMGAPTDGYGSFAAAIRGYVSPELVEDGVRITSLDFVDGKVSIKVEGETETAGSAWVNGKKELSVWCQVQWKPSLTSAVWQPLGDEVEITVGTEAKEIAVEMPDADANSGYFSVRVYKK